MHPKCTQVPCAHSPTPKTLALQSWNSLNSYTVMTLSHIPWSVSSGFPGLQEEQNRQPVHKHRPGGAAESCAQDAFRNTFKECGNKSI